MFSKLVFGLPVLLVTAGLIACVQGQLAPRVSLPGPFSSVTGVYVAYNESEFLGVETTFEAFLGIPYAEPPVGDLRFAKPVRKGSLGLSYLAITDKAVCPQISPLDDIIPTNPLIGRDVDEDCLYLSVYTPSPRVSQTSIYSLNVVEWKSTLLGVILGITSFWNGNPLSK